MPRVSAAAFGLALGAAAVHALWNLLIARTGDPQAATGVAMAAAVVALATPPYVAAIRLARGRGALARELTGAAVLAGVAMFAAYALALVALKLAGAAEVGAVRETSVVIATALAAIVLRERISAARWAGALAVTAGIAVIALG